MRYFSLLITTLICIPIFADSYLRDPSCRETFNSYSNLAPRIWHGQTLSKWLKQYGSHGFQTSLTRVPMAVGITGVSTLNSVTATVDQMLFKKKVEASKLDQPPIFILGHWRSGTTLLHELMNLDENHFSPTTFQTMAPESFLATPKWLIQAIQLTMPKKRPMDNVEFSLNSPQEDEFALCNMGAPSPYSMLSHANWGRSCNLSIKNLDADSQKKWETALKTFHKRVAYKKKGRLILKSPTHTARIEELLKIYPNAKFIHISRDPAKLYLSTMKMWKALIKVQGIKIPKNFEGLSEFVLKNHQIMYDEYFATRNLLNSNQLIEVRFRELTHQPENTVKRIYSRLGLPMSGFTSLALRTKSNQMNEYVPNHFETEERLIETLKTHWKDYYQEFGY